MNNTSISEHEDRDSSVCVQQMIEGDTWEKTDLYDVLLHALNTGDTSIFTRLSQQETLERFEQIDTLYLDLDGTSLEQGATVFPPGFIQKLQALQKAGVRIIFVTGKPESEIRALMATVPPEVPLSFVFEKGGYRIDRTKQDLEPQVSRLLATEETEKTVDRLRESIYAEFAPVLSRRHGIRVHPAGDGSHRSLVSIDILRGDVTDEELQKEARFNLKVSDRELLARIKKDLQVMLQESFAGWELTDLGNGNFELHQKDQAKEKGVLRTPEFHDGMMRLAVDDSANGLSMLRLKHQYSNIMAGVIYNRHTAPEVVDEADVAIAGEATVDILLQHIIDAKGIDENVYVISNTPPMQQKGGAWVTSIGAPVAIARAVDVTPNSRWFFPSQTPAVFRDGEPVTGHEELWTKLVPVSITPAQHRSHYGSIANKVLWKGSHPDAFDEVPTFPEADWDNYLHVNRNIAREVVAGMNGSKSPLVVWVQDFQVAALAAELHGGYDKHKIKMGFFWHIPFPEPQQFIERLTEKGGSTRRARQLLQWLSQYDIVGFHCEEYVRNYQETCRMLGVKPARCIAQPISIDVEGTADYARGVLSHENFQFENPVLNNIFNQTGETSVKVDVVLNGLERADPIKGSKLRLQAMLDVAMMNPELFDGKVVIEGLSESRTATDPSYKQYYDDCRLLIDKINDQLNKREVVKQIGVISKREEVVALIAKSRYAMITSVADGYNMVGPEMLVTWNATRTMVDHPRTMFMSDRTGFIRSLNEKGYGGAVPLAWGPITRESLYQPIADLLSGRTGEPDYEKLARYFADHTMQKWVERNVRATRHTGFEKMKEV